MIKSDIVYYSLLSSERQAGVNKGPAYREHTEMKQAVLAAERGLQSHTEGTWAG